ncbi:hypothetical protein V6N12_016548 [Hibiscus sabdariffa]|uniref:Uncharacterized protein n=1 Tax=Hibiscus sabdariffa TaxID=183260 RepID=A0ABR2CDX7_9ROSI
MENPDQRPALLAMKDHSAYMQCMSIADEGLLAVKATDRMVEIYSNGRRKIKPSDVGNHCLGWGSQLWKFAVFFFFVDM